MNKKCVFAIALSLSILTNCSKNKSQKDPVDTNAVLQKAEVERLAEESARKEKKARQRAAEAEGKRAEKRARLAREEAAKEEKKRANLSTV